MKRSHTELVVTIETTPVDVDAEAYVYSCDHDVDSTVYIVGNDIRHWQKRFKKFGPIGVMTCIFSHEAIHTAILTIEDEKTSIKLDNLFGHGVSSKRDYHGLARLKRKLFDAKRKQKFI